MSKNHRIKILVLSHISELLGGAERSMLDVFDYWSTTYEIEPEFILREPVKSLSTEIKKRGWKYYALDYTFWSDGNPPKEIEDILQNSRRNQKAVREIEEVIKNTKPDIVMTNSVVCPWAAIAANNQQLPHVWFVREYGDLDHGRIYEIGREKTYQDVDTMSEVVVANSVALSNYLKKYINPNKVTTLYNPFDIVGIQKKSQSKITNLYRYKKSLKLVITGNLAPSKGQHEAIEAVAMLNNKDFEVELCVIGRFGDKKYQSTLESYIKKHNIEDKVHFVGYQTNPLPYISLADVCIMASRKEAFGRVTFEYISLAKAVVGVDSGATPEMVVSGKNGYLYEYGDAKGLTLAIENYAKNNKLSIIHGQESLNIAKKMMSGDLNIDALYKKIENLHNKKHMKKENINYLKYWRELFDKYGKIKVKSTAPIHAKIKGRLKRKTKAAYIKIRSIKRKVSRR